MYIGLQRLVVGLCIACVVLFVFVSVWVVWLVLGFEFGFYLGLGVILGWFLVFGFGWVFCCMRDWFFRCGLLLVGCTVVFTALFCTVIIAECGSVMA